MVTAAALLLISVSIALAVYLAAPAIVKGAANGRQRLLEKAGRAADGLHLAVSPERMWKAALILGLVSGLTAGIALGGPLPGLVVWAVCMLLPRLFIALSRKKRAQEMERALPVMIEKIASSVRAGLGLREAFERAGEAAGGPLMEEVRRATGEMRINVPFDEAVTRMARRVPLADASVFCTALVIAQRTGGFVSAVLDSIAVSLREKRALDGKVKALTSQGKMQGVIIGSLPVALLFAVYLLDPQMVRPLFDTLIGRLMLAGGALLEVVGFLVIRKMTDIKY